MTAKTTTKKKTKSKATGKKRGPQQMKEKRQEAEMNMKVPLNVESIKKAVGRPRSFESAEELYERSMEYFQFCEENKRIPNKAGLCLFLGICHDTMAEYRKGVYDEGCEGLKFSETLKAIFSAIEESWVQNLPHQSAAGSIFYLKNAFKETYKDTHTYEGTVGHTHELKQEDQERIDKLLEQNK